MTLTAFNWSDPLPWDGPGAIDGVVEELAGDRLDRARYATFLTNYLAAEGKQRNYVLNLNAEWGAGKTWFIKRWYMELKEHYPTVYIDAWQQDFSDDPLLTVISSIIDQLKEVAGKENKIPEGMRQRLLGLFKVGGKLALKAAIQKAGLEDDDFSLEGDDADKLVDALCNNQKERYDSIQYLKREIREWVEGSVGLSNGSMDYPAFILIDELDRCRPSYAVEMLETIKHIFDVKGVVFVLATDTAQLQHAVKVIYGSDFDAQTYLSRFFSRRFSLLGGSRLSFVESHLGKNRFINNDIFERIWPRGLDTGSLATLIAAIADACHLSLRGTEKLIDRSLLAILSISSDMINIAFLTYLIALHETKPSDYETVISLTRSHANLTKIKMATIKPYGMSELSGLIKVNLGRRVEYSFLGGSYSIQIINLIRDYLWSYLGEHEDIRAKLKTQNKDLVDNWPRISEEEHSERLKYYVLCDDLNNRSDVGMAIYRDWVELAMSFE